MWHQLVIKSNGLFPKDLTSPFWTFCNPKRKPEASRPLHILPVSSLTAQDLCQPPLCGKFTRVCDVLCWLAFSHSFLPKKFAQFFSFLSDAALLFSLLSASGITHQGLFPNLLPVEQASLISLLFIWAKNRFWGLIIGASRTNQQCAAQRLPLPGGRREGLPGALPRTDDACSSSSFCRGQRTPNTMLLHSRGLGLNSPTLGKDIWTMSSSQYCNCNCVESLTRCWAESHLLEVRRKGECSGLTVANAQMSLLMLGNFNF